LPAFTAAKKSSVSYWWFAGSAVLPSVWTLEPIAATELGRVCCGFDVDA
jgi:hypothetical protein